MTTPPLRPWYVDRSRYELGLQHCLAARHYEYNHLGTGIRAGRRSLPLLTGTGAHEPIADILQVVKAGGVPSDADIRTLIDGAQDRFMGAAEAGFSVREGPPMNPIDHAFTVKEQCALIEGMTWGWARTVLPVILEHFTIMAVEEEYLLELDPDYRGFQLVLQTTPDFVARDRRTGELGVHDPKTAAKIDDRWRAGWVMSAQMMVQTRAAELAYEEPCTHYWIHGLLKERRGKFTSKGRETGERQYSHLLYASIEPHNPPVNKGTKWKTSGYWIDKRPIWETTFSQNEAGMRPVEWWVKNGLTNEELGEMFVLAGPYQRQGHMIDQLLKEMVTHERWWIDTYLDHGPAPEWSGRIVRSWQCQYGPGFEPCSFIPLCQQQAGYEDPLRMPSAKFVRREPHHDAEKVLQQQQTQGEGK